MMSILADFEYTAITIAIDKAAHKAKYQHKCMHPYHYCVEALLERYCRFLESKRAKGDVMAEARGSKEDRKLSDVFKSFVERGTANVSKEAFATSGVPSGLILKGKSDNIAGLQLADLIAHPALKHMVAVRLNQAVPTDFGAGVVAILEAQKWRRSSAGKIDGYGRKWLP